jgi:hypothetical protein
MRSFRLIYKILLLNFLLLIQSQAFGFDKDFKIESDRVPTEFGLLFESLKFEIKTDKEKFKMVGLIQEIGENLGILEKEHIFFLLKSEVIKNLLEFKFEKVRQFDVSTLLIERLEQDFSKKEKYLNPFSQWIWRSIIAELNYRRKSGFINNNSFNPSLFQGTKRAEALRFERYLKYIMPWIDKMDSLSSSQFNQFSKEVSWLILERINDRSIFFKRYASTLVTDTKVRLFNIPQKLLDIHPEDFKKIQKGDSNEPDLQEKSQKAKSEAETSLEKINVDDMSPMAEEIIKTIDNASQ